MKKKKLFLLTLFLLACVIQVSAQSSTDAEEVYLEYCMKYTVPKFAASQLKQLIFNREQTKDTACQSANSALERVKIKLQVDSTYQDSINLILIPYNNISGENLGYALRLCNRGFCSKKQMHKLQEKALDMAHRLEKNPRMNVWNEEMEFLQKVLSKKQQVGFFELKYIDKINNDLNTAWKKLTDANLDIELDSATDYPQAYQYFVKVNMTNELYRYQEELRVKNLEELRKHQPYVIRLLEGLENKKRVEKKDVGSEFIW